jgi:AraC-like DNA-binding protein
MPRENAIHAMSAGAAAVRVTFSRDAVCWHTHAGTVFMCIDNGERTLVTADAMTRLAVGDGAVVPAGQAHAFAAAPPPGCSYRVIHIAGMNRPMPAGRIADAAWRTAFERAFMAIEHADALAEAAVAELVGCTCERLPDSWKPPLEPGSVRRARQLVQTDPSRGLHLSDVAHAAGMSAFHLHRLYRRLWGVTPAQHGLEARLREARSALLAGATVATAAAASGFADQSHLTRAFRRFMGVPPERWRRQVVGRTESERSRRR